MSTKKEKLLDAVREELKNNSVFCKSELSNARIVEILSIQIDSHTPSEIGCDSIEKWETVSCSFKIRIDKNNNGCSSVHDASARFTISGYNDETNEFSVSLTGCITVL